MPRWLRRHETLLAIILVIALIGLGAFNDRFLTVDNLLNQGRLMTEIGLIALPMTFIIITGGIDLSVGAIVGLCAVMLGYSWKNFGFPLPLAIVFALAVGGLAGFVNGLVITRVKVPPLIMTIATLALYRGLAEGDQPGPFGARLSRMVLCPWPGRPVRRADATLVLVSPYRGRGRRARPHDLRPHALCDRRQRDGCALLRVCPSIGSSSSSIRYPGWPPASPPSSSSPA